MSENKTVEELEQELETLQGQVDTLTSENEQLKAAAEENPEGENPEDEDPKVKELRERIETMEAERHQEIVNDTIEARVKAGLMKEKDREKEAERLTDLDDEALGILREDAGNVAEKLAKASSTGPKAKYTATSKSAFDEAVEDTRERLFGHRKEAEK